MFWGGAWCNLKAGCEVVVRCCVDNAAWRMSTWNVHHWRLRCRYWELKMSSCAQYDGIYLRLLHCVSHSCWLRLAESIMLRSGIFPSVCLSVPSVYSPWLTRGPACDMASVHFGRTIRRTNILFVTWSVKKVMIEDYKEWMYVLHIIQLQLLYIYFSFLQTGLTAFSVVVPPVFIFTKHCYCLLLW